MPPEKLVRIAFLEAGEAHQLDVAADDLLAVDGRDALHLQAEGNVVVHRHPGEQRVILEHHRTLPGRLAHRLAIDQDAADRGLLEAGHHGQQRGLAAAAVAQHGTELVVLDAEADIVQRQYRFVIGAVAGVGSCLRSLRSGICSCQRSIPRDQGSSRLPNWRMIWSSSRPMTPIEAMPTMM
jgi:hypothetical protein